MNRVALFLAGLVLAVTGWKSEKLGLLSPGVLIMIAALSGCCTSTLQRGCDPMPKWHGYELKGGDAP